ncbi:MAG: UvrD-helicase domain-containing protein [Spirochaetales bacterium]|uniref:DNA 3'-5' helicase n=1 Tax=Candidatus Thalassospirochaeta sargassi TaxID=3119039 RepID=A0AAJ1IFD5_9SPIO|nr:UvrD-helicase domain-containing protein [Spirochaetales bacterium]
MDYLESLNPVQREAATYEGSSLLILAGAGSGKTRVITTRIAWLIDQKLMNPRSILAVTFTNKAAGEMRERVEQMVPGAGAGVMIRTFHSFGAWLMRTNYHLTPDLKSSFSIYDDDDSVSLLQTIFPDKTKKKLSPYAGWISRAKDYCLTPEDDLSSITTVPDFADVYSLYEKKLRAIGNLDFGGLISRPIELLESNEELRRRVRQRFRVVMVDEYQDSNVAQFELLKQLTGEGNSICVVGDDDQSIYKFRGAEVKNILNFPEQFPGTKIIKLEQNYRSTAPILEIASGVVANNSSRLGKKLWTERKEGSNAKVVYLENQAAEADFCAKLLEDGNLGGTAILYRTNAQSMSFETCFSRLDIPYKIIGALRFLEREEIKDIIALLSLLMNPDDVVAFTRIINKPARAMGKVTVNKIIAEAGRLNCDLLTAGNSIKLSAKAAAGFENFTKLYAFMDENIDKMPLAEFIAELVTESRLLEHYLKKDENTAQAKENNLNELVSAASGYGDGREGLSLFLEELELDREAISRKNGSNTGGGAAIGDENAVTLITMHNTKGLEFDRVIITGMEEGLFPSGREETPEEIEEERRIFYVSITRARNELYLTSCRSRRIWGRTQYFGPSMFLSELPEDYTEVVDGQIDEAYGYGGRREVSVGQEMKYKPGTPVYHEDYGSGIIAKSGTAGDQVYVIVQFESGRSGRFLPAYDSHLEIFGNDEWN